MRFILNAFAVFFALAACPAAAQQKPLQVEVLRSSEGSLFANSTLIMGDKDAVLVDPPFTRADAYRLAAMVLESGKRLTYVFVTHDHPDHFFSMEVIQDAFPDAKIVANPIVVADIWRSLPFKVKRWGPVLGRNGPIHPTAPLPLDGDTIMLEGREIKILGPMEGDHVHATALWVPSIRALIAGDLVFNQVFPWASRTSPGKRDGLGCVAGPAGQAGTADRRRRPFQTGLAQRCQRPGLHACVPCRLAQTRGRIEGLEGPGGPRAQGLSRRDRCARQFHPDQFGAGREG